MEMGPIQLWEQMTWLAKGVAITLTELDIKPDPDLYGDRS